MSHRFIGDKYANFKTLGLKRVHDTKLPPGVESLCCEIYNPGTESNWNRVACDIHLKNIHPEKHLHKFFGLPSSHWEGFICKPGEWVFLPHGLYIRELFKDGKPYPIENYRAIINVGDAMFKGEKLPSRPEAKKIRVFQ